MGWGGECRRSWDADCASRSEKKVCLFASLILFRPRVNVKSCPCPGAGDSAPRNSPSFSAIRPFRREAREGRQRLCPAGRGPCLLPAWGRPHPLSASSFPPAPHLAQLSSARLLCARRVLASAGGALEPHRGCSDPLCPALCRFS